MRSWKSISRIRERSFGRREIIGQNEFANTTSHDSKSPWNFYITEQPMKAWNNVGYASRYVCNSMKIWSFATCSTYNLVSAVKFKIFVEANRFQNRESFPAICNI